MATERWIDLLDRDVYRRLANCCSKKRDIIPLTQAKWAVLRNTPGNWSREDALIQVLELLDSNSQPIDLTKDEYDDIIHEII